MTATFPAFVGLQGVSAAAPRADSSSPPTWYVRGWCACSASGFWPVPLLQARSRVHVHCICCACALHGQCLSVHPFRSCKPACACLCAASVVPGCRVCTYAGRKAMVAVCALGTTVCPLDRSDPSLLCRDERRLLIRYPNFLAVVSKLIADASWLLVKNTSASESITSAT